MGNYNKVLYDELDREYERKNLYLRELAELQSRKENASDRDEEAGLDLEIKNFIKNKDSHKYNIELEEYKREEKAFLRQCSEDRKNYKEGLDKTLPHRLRYLEAELYLSYKKMDFYKDYVDLSYEAELLYKENKIVNRQLPEVLDEWKENIREIEIAKKGLSNVDDEEDRKIREDIRIFKREEKKRYREKVRETKRKRRQKEISQRAETNRLERLKREYKDSIRLKSFDSEKNSLKETIKNKNSEIKTRLNTNVDIINANISDVRRVTPVELEKRRPFVSYLTFLFPGLAQLLNGQRNKGLLLLLATLFIYLLAIPYALGFGNYQGEGIRGLLTLAEGGLRIHKSLIFMIEGVIAIFLVIISLAIIYLSFKDGRKVEKNSILGIRPNNWFETLSTIKNKGFPYVVTTPALIIIIFIILVPVTTTILLSFTGMDPQHQSKFSWVGIKNYKMIALGKGLAGSVFWSVLGWTILWTLAATSLAIFIGFGLALLTNNERIKGKKIFRTIFILPWAVPAFITIMFFSIMMSPHGAITELIMKLTGLKVGIKTSTNLTRLALIFIQGWLGSSYIFLLITGVLQAIPGDLYEAADIDGATRWDKLRKITLPMVLFQTAPILIGQYTFNFNNFSIIYLFNSGGPFDPTKYGNLAGSSDILISYIYKLTMENQYQAIGAAITVVISSVLMFVTYLGYANSKAFKEERL